MAVAAAETTLVHFSELRRIRKSMMSCGEESGTTSRKAARTWPHPHLSHVVEDDLRVAVLAFLALHIFFVLLRFLFAAAVHMQLRARALDEVRHEVRVDPSGRLGDHRVVAEVRGFNLRQEGAEDPQGEAAHARRGGRREGQQKDQTAFLKKQWHELRECE